MGTVVAAVVGLCGTGKSEASRILEEQFGAHRVYFGGYVRAEMNRRGLSITPENERWVREDMRATQGMDVIAKLSLPEIQSSVSTGANVVIDGLYSYAEYTLLRQEYEDRLFVIALHASKATRYRRMSSRLERPLLPDQVNERDMSEIQNLQKATTIVMADYHIVNDPRLFTTAPALPRRSILKSIARLRRG
jgi:dephospho-CoA kinase